MTYSFFKAHEMAWPFLLPVDPRKVVDYYKIITDPMGKIYRSQSIF